MVRLLIDGEEHVVDGQEWTGPQAEHLQALSDAFAQRLGGETPWPDYALAEYVARVTGGQITASTPDDLPEDAVF